MSTTVSKIIKLAQSWVGKNEKDGSHKEIIDIYNSHKPLARSYKVKYTDEWCSTTISALAVKLGATDIIPTECSCEKQIELFKKLGCFVENESVTPESGWIIYYDWNDNGTGDNKGWSDHVGIVENVSNGTITVIEGNMSEAVGRRTIKVNAKYIRGYAVPKYTKEEVKATESIETVAKEVISGKYGDGKARKTALEKLGYDYDKVQAKVNELLAKKTTTATKKTVKVGSTVKVSTDAVIGGLALNRGNKASSYLTSNKWTVTKIQTIKGVEEALLSCNTWIATKYLTVV